MSLIKLAVNSSEPQQRAPGKLGSWALKHPLLTAGIGLTGGIAAADVATGMFKNKFISGKPIMDGFKNNLKEGAVYGAALSAVEPLIIHKGLGVPPPKPQEKQK